VSGPDRCEKCNAPDWDCPCAVADNDATGQDDDTRDGLLPYFGPEDDAA
jgi:hypothetical protein